MQGFYVNMDYHNIAPDAVIDNYTVCFLLALQPGLPLPVVPESLRHLQQQARLH